MIAVRTVLSNHLFFFLHLVYCYIVIIHNSGQYVKNINWQAITWFIQANCSHCNYIWINMSMTWTCIKKFQHGFSNLFPNNWPQNQWFIIAHIKYDVLSSKVWMNIYWNGKVATVSWSIVNESYEDSKSQPSTPPMIIRGLFANMD